MNRTENTIIEAFWELLNEKPYNKITVNNIVKKCEMNRNTFYYHFHDIPDLLEKSIKKETDAIILKHQHYEFIDDYLKPIVQSILDRKKAIFNIYHSIDRDIFLNELEKILLYYVDQYIDIIIQDFTLQSQDRQLLVRFYKSTLIGITLDWLNEGMNYDLVEDFIQISQLLAHINHHSLMRTSQK